MAETTVTLVDTVNTTFKVQYFHISDNAGSGGSPTADGSGSGIKSGRFGDNSVFRTMILLQMPKAHDVYSTSAATGEEIGHVDTDVTVANIEFDIKTVASGTGEKDVEGPHVLRHLPQFPKNASMDSGQGLPTHNALEQTFHGSDNVKKDYYGTSDTLGNILGAIDDTTNFGYGPTGVIDYILPRAVNTKYTINLKNYVKEKSLTWGDRVAFILEKEPTNGLGDAVHGTVEDDGIVGLNGWSTTQSIIDNLTAMDVKLTYDDPPPTRPVIELTPDNDMISGVLKLTTKSPERDVVRLTTKFTTGTPTTIGNGKGVVYTGSTNRIINYGINKDTLKQADSEIDSDFLETEGTQYNIVVFSEDNVNQVSSNMISHTRLSCTGSLSAGTAIGGELTLTISGFSDAGNSSAAEFVKFGVNWDGEATATNDSINDYTIVTLDGAATTATVKHTFHKAGTYKVNVCVIDDKGFRSDFTQAASRTIVSSNPVAVLRASRDTAVRAKYGDEFSVVTLSASHSYPVGSDRMIFAHKFQHNSNTPVTTYPMENDNSNFNDVTTTVKLKCNRDNCASTVLKVYGKVSVSSDGTPNVDNDANFDHYEYQVHEVSPSDTKDTYGTVAQTGGENVLFKSVDFVVVSTLDGTDVVGTTNGAVYTLADGDGNIINNKIRAAKDADMWGGYHAVGAVQVDFTNSNSTIHYDSGMSPASFLEQGFVPGDTIYVDSAVADAANNDFFTIASVTDTDIVVNETLTDESNDAGVYIYKVNGPTLPIASYDVNTPTITCSVRQALAESTTSQNLATSSNVTQALRFVSEEYNTLDLDTQADAGHLAIQNANLKRGGGLNSLMALGGKSYPVGTTRTKMGTPLVSLNVRALTQTGYRQIWNLIEGGRYEWATIDSKKIDTPGTAYKQLRMRLSDGSIAKDPAMASQYTASLNFIVIGELVT